MCLLITGPSNGIRNALLNTEGLLGNIYKKNSDGVGAMYASVEGLHTPKYLPNNLGECITFIEALPDDDRDLALHFRYKTHGKVDLLNCHPYPVIEGAIAISMMHNGVLSRGNKADTNKSDTWHYIQDIVAPIVEEFGPDALQNDGIRNLLESDIGSGNRFAFMDSDGRLTVLNKDTGIEHGELWFSNTYAWDPELLIPTYKKFKQTNWGNYGYANRDAWDDYEGFDAKRGSPSKGTVIAIGTNVSVSGTAGAQNGATQKVEGVDLTKAISAGAVISQDDVWAVLRQADARELGYLLNEKPLFALSTLLHKCDFIVAKDHTGYDESELAVIKALTEQDGVMLHAMCTRSLAAATIVAEVMCWYGDFVGKPHPVETTQLEMAHAIWEARKASREKTVASENLVDEIVRRTAPGSNRKAAERRAAAIEQRIDEEIDAEVEEIRAAAEYVTDGDPEALEEEVATAEDEAEQEIRARFAEYSREFEEGVDAVQFAEGSFAPILPPKYEGMSHAEKNWFWLVVAEARTRRKEALLAADKAASAAVPDPDDERVRQVAVAMGYSEDESVAAANRIKEFNARMAAAGLTVDNAPLLAAVNNSTGARVTSL